MVITRYLEIIQELINLEEIWDKRKRLRDEIIAKKKEVKALEQRWKYGNYDGTNIEEKKK